MAIRNNYTAAGDGERFLILRPAAGDTSEPLGSSLVDVVHWREWIARQGGFHAKNAACAKKASRNFEGRSEERGGLCELLRQDVTRRRNAG